METRAKAKSVPMLDRSVRVPMSKRPAGMATTMPATQVAMAGVRYLTLTLEKKLGSQAVPRHGEPDARLAELEDQDGGDHPRESADEDDEVNPAEGVIAGQERELSQGVDDGRRIVHHAMPGDEAGEDDGDADVEDGADDQGGDDADGEVALGVAALFGSGGDGVEADVGEEDDRAAGEDAGPAVGSEGVIEGGLDELRAYEEEDEDRAEFDEHHDVVWCERIRGCRGQGRR